MLWVRAVFSPVSLYLLLSKIALKDNSVIFRIGAALLSMVCVIRYIRTLPLQTLPFVCSNSDRKPWPRNSTSNQRQLSEVLKASAALYPQERVLRHATPGITLPAFLKLISFDLIALISILSSPRESSRPFPSKPPVFGCGLVAKGEMLCAYDLLRYYS